MEFRNAENTADYSPFLPEYDSWIDFWESHARVIFNIGKLCCLSGCGEEYNLGAHIIIDDDEISEEIENRLNEELANLKSASQDDKKMLSLKSYISPITIEYEGLKFVVRRDAINKSRSKSPDSFHKPMFIVAFCDQGCNNITDTFELKPGTILVPLYSGDQKKKI